MSLALLPPPASGELDGIPVPVSTCNIWSTCWNSAMIDAELAALDIVVPALAVPAIGAEPLAVVVGVVATGVVVVGVVATGVVVVGVLTTGGVTTGATGAGVGTVPPAPLEMPIRSPRIRTRD